MIILSIVDFKFFEYYNISMRWLIFKIGYEAEKREWELLASLCMKVAAKQVVFPFYLKLQLHKLKKLCMLL